MIHLLRLLLLYIAVHKTPPLSSSPNSVSTPLGHVPYRAGRGNKRQPWRSMVSARWHDET